VEVLAGADDVTFPAAVAHADVEVAVRAEGHLAAVVVAVGIVDLHDHPRAVRIRLVGVVFGDLVLDEQGGAVEPEVGVADVKKAVLLELRVEFDGVEALLQKGADRLILDVQKRLCQEFAVLDDAHKAVAFTDEQPAGAVLGG
jgi:hypothetical protein